MSTRFVIIFSDWVWPCSDYSSFPSSHFKAAYPNLPYIRFDFFLILTLTQWCYQTKKNDVALSDMLTRITKVDILVASIFTLFIRTSPWTQWIRLSMIQTCSVSSIIFSSQAQTQCSFCRSSRDDSLRNVRQVRPIKLFVDVTSNSRLFLRSGHAEFLFSFPRT